MVVVSGTKPKNATGLTAIGHASDNQKALMRDNGPTPPACPDKGPIPPDCTLNLSIEKYIILRSNICRTYYKVRLAIHFFSQSVLGKFRFE